MGQLSIRKVKYFGKEYHYESPDFEDGINIIVGPNGTGKSTLMNLIYFGFGGVVDEFRQDGKEVHTEIVGDTENYVEIEFEVNKEKYVIQRLFSTNDITLFLPEENVIILPIYRSGEQPTFSDWLLKKLGIEVVELFQGNSTFKINFYHLSRLFFHDQKADPDGIYKEPDVKNYYEESEMLRKAIFQLLLGGSYFRYYDSLAKLRSLDKDRNTAKSVLNEFDSILSKLKKSKEDVNLVFLNKRQDELKSELNRLYLLREGAKSDRSSPANALNVIEDIKAGLISAELNVSNIRNQLNAYYEELSRMQRVKENIGLEIAQLKKIIHTHEKLNLFSADTCVYCLRSIQREHGKCICGKEIDEKDYERFFYSHSEYLDILKSKQKSVQTVESAIASCMSDITLSEEKVHEAEINVNRLKEQFSSSISSMDSSVDMTTINQIDDQIFEVRKDLANIEQQIDVEAKREVLQNEFDTLQEQYDSRKNTTDKLEAEANEDIRVKVSSFSSKYGELMRNTVENCKSARISPVNYLPIVNGGQYTEASASVSKRLMYYFTLLYMSLTYPDVTFPKLLLIDNPENLGIDHEKLANCIDQIKNVITDNAKNSGYQVILTTGVGKYPENLKDHVVITLTEQDRLLKKN